MAARATREPNLTLRQEYDQLTLFYVRLADQAERNAKTDVVYETPQRTNTGQPQQQHQQQQQQQQQLQPNPKLDGK